MREAAMGKKLNKNQSRSGSILSIAVRVRLKVAFPVRICQVEVQKDDIKSGTRCSEPEVFVEQKENRKGGKKISDFCFSVISYWLVNLTYKNRRDLIFITEEGWVVCRVFKKRVASQTRIAVDPIFWYDDHVSLMPDLDSPRQLVHHPQMVYQNHIYNCKPELELHHLLPHESFLQMPQLESPNKLQNYINNHGTTVFSASTTPEESAQNLTDWRVLDKFVASQLSHENGANKEHSCSENTPIFQTEEKQEGAVDYASTSTSCGQNDSWE
ncbi:NAC domain-containing protein 7-like protein [Carex littledalei]|uniref:NAC domain-containing protein 7-like protein n=1 Tax=Carex littledalei TaxID=544730 RepID=A0A833QP20_9POAL|nr:NAC domain-containing protein 7-like protein [Carex littledalei]